jgi:triacylglycerol lipase
MPHRLAHSLGVTRSIAQETFCTIRQLGMLPSDLRTIVPTCQSGADVVLLIHGFMASAGVFRPMRRAIARRTGSVIASFTHPPGWGVKRIAHDLAEVVSQLPEETRVHLVGHSLGGIVARWYVQELGGHNRVRQTFSLASPFGGAPLAGHFPYFVGADLCPKSAVLERIRARAHVGAVPHTSLVAEFDPLLVPIASQSAFGRGEVVIVPGKGHNSLLYDRAVAACIAERMLGSGGPASELRAS